MKKYKYRTTFRFEGKRYEVVANTKKGLYEKLAKKRYELEHDRSVVSSRMIFREWVSQCIETYKTNLADSTKLRFEQSVRHS